MLLAIVIFYVVSILEILAYLPQIVKLFKTKSSKDLSVGSQVLCLVMNAGWLWYFVLTNVTPGQCILSIVLVCEILLQFLLVIIYRKK